MELSIKRRRFGPFGPVELTLAWGEVFIRVGSWEAYWNALHGLTIG